MPGYVVGFVFANDDGRHDNHKVIVVKKRKPDFMAGKYNGVGGKMMDDEIASAAMLREWREETNGFKVYGWREFATITRPSAVVYCFAAKAAEPLVNLPNINDIGEPLDVIDWESVAAEDFFDTVLALLNLASLSLKSRLTIRLDDVR